MYPDQRWPLKLGEYPLTEHADIFRVSAEIPKQLKASEVLLVLLYEVLYVKFQTT